MCYIGSVKKRSGLITDMMENTVRHSLSTEIATEVTPKQIASATNAKRNSGDPNLKGRLGRHKTANCLICKLPRAARLRAEEDYANWTSAHQIAQDLASRGYGVVNKSTVYRHAIAMNLDVKRASNMDKGVSRIIDKGFELLDEGRLLMRSSDLIAAITLKYRVEGRLSDNQAINNVLIRNNIQPLEEIAKIKDPAELGDKAAQIIRELQEAGVLPGMAKLSDEKVHYNRVAEITQRIIEKKADKDVDDGAGEADPNEVRVLPDGS